MSNLISLSGFKGSGKDSVFKELPKIFPNYNFKRLAWADPLKKEVSEIFGIDLKLLHTDEETKNNTLTDINVGTFLFHAKKVVPMKKWFTTFSLSNRYLTVREVLQYWGTDVRRAQDPEYWIKKTIGLIDTHPNSEDILVLTDTRFENELKAIHKRQGISVWLDRLQGYGHTDPHISEKNLKGHCMWIVNSRGYQVLEDTMNDLELTLRMSRNSPFR